MRFCSTRNKEHSVSFSQAVLNFMPDDGGLYVPYKTEDLRRWILYTDENTTFTSIAGTLTSAFINEEFSPIICETIAMRAFKFSPAFRQLDENLFLLELSTGPTGMHRDFGISYLVSFLETILQMNSSSAVFLDVSTGELGASLAYALRGKKNIKSVIVYPKDKARGLEESDFIWNGGNIFPVEVDGDEEVCRSIVREIFSDKDFINQRKLTVANTSNIGRLLPQAFFYPFAFSRLKNKVHSDIFYALAAGNYSNVVAGLYSWQLALPLNGFIIPSTNSLGLDAEKKPVLLDSFVPLNKRTPADPSAPSNLERLEAVFSANELMMKHFIYPVELNDVEVSAAAKELFLKYGVYADRHTARAYAASKKNLSIKNGEEHASVLIARDHPSLSGEFVQHTLGEKVQMPESVEKSLELVKINKPCIKSVLELRRIIEDL